MSPAQKEILEAERKPRKPETPATEPAKTPAPVVDEHAPKTDAHAPAHSGEEIPTDLKRPGIIAIILVTILLLGVLAGIFAIGWYPHQKAEQQIKADVAERNSDIPMVEVDHPTKSPGWIELKFFCDVKPNQETLIYPQATGYMKKLYVDIQDKVKQGQLLAEIDEKDVDAQLAQSKASLAQSHANVVKSQSDYDLASRTYDRYKNLTGQNGQVVTQQELDEKLTAKDNAYSTLNLANAAVGVAEANVQRLEVLQSYQKVIAPFDGTITSRNYDVGALLMPGTTAPGKEMFRITQSETVRVFVNIPQTDATNLHVGQEALLTVRNYPGRVFKGKVAREAGALNPNTRTEPFQLDFDNPDGALVAGMYGEAKLRETDSKPTLIVPTGALIFNSAGVQVMTIKDDKVHFKQVKLGRDLGTQLEVLEGVSPDDLIVTNPGARLNEGDTARVIMAKPAATAPAAK